MNGEDAVRLSKDELDVLLIEAARKGAQEALERVGLGDEQAAGDVREWRGMLESFRYMKRTVIKSAIGRLVDYGIMIVLFGLAAKLGLKFISPDQFR